MLDLPDQPPLDKNSLVGGCSRLSLRVDAERLRVEVAALPSSFWGSRGGRVGVHNPAEAVFLRGYAPAEGERPLEDRPALEHLPYVRTIMFELIPAPPQRALLARLPGGATIAPHIDRAPYFAKTVRVHVPVETHDRVFMVSGALTYRMRAGEVWALNNSASHAVWNADARLSRTHLICDYTLTPALAELLGTAERALGEERIDVNAHVSAGGAGGVGGVGGANG